MVNMKRIVAILYLALTYAAVQAQSYSQANCGSYFGKQNPAIKRYMIVPNMPELPGEGKWAHVLYIDGKISELISEYDFWLYLDIDTSGKVLDYCIDHSKTEITAELRAGIYKMIQEMPLFKPGTNEVNEPLFVTLGVPVQSHANWEEIIKKQNKKKK